MDLIHWGNGLADPLLEFESLQEEINRLFEGIRPPEPKGLFERAFSPAVDVIENADRFEVLCDVPGLDAGEVDASISGSVLTIKGGHREPAGNGSADVFRTDRRFGEFQRTIQLPLTVNAAQVEATLKDGVLRIVLPKQEELKPRQISVKAK